MQSSPPGLWSPRLPLAPGPLPLPPGLLAPVSVPGAPAVDEVPQVSQGAPPSLARVGGWSAQTDTVLSVYRRDLSTGVSSVASTKPASDDVLVHLFPQEIINPVTSLPHQADLVGLDGKVADEAHRLPLGVDHFVSPGDRELGGGGWHCVFSSLSVVEVRGES